MKLSDGLTRTLPSISMFVLYGLSFGFLALALKKIDVSIAYAVWAGMGTALIATAIPAQSSTLHSWSYLSNF
ncbi:MAG: SMR family transporter [Euryarchaeota archaeon]|nr:SMR family transporter [Euryarchaeota archaeon]